MSHKFGSLVASDKPYKTLIKLDGRQIVDNSGQPFFIESYAEDSLVGRRFDKEWREHLLSLAKDGKDAPTAADHNIAKCAALTAAWHLVDPETLEPISEPCTRENALELYSMPMAAWLWVQPWASSCNHVNFIKRSAKSSMPTQSGSSETTGD